MKLDEIELGGRYVAKVSERLVVVRITAIETRPASRFDRAKTVLQAINEQTGRPINVRSPQRLRKAASP